MEGKEVRFGITTSVLRVTTSNGRPYNSMHDSKMIMLYILAGSISVLLLICPGGSDQRRTRRFGD